MTPRDTLILLIPFAYLLGSIPFGLLIAKRKGIDPRLEGSGNIGASNVGRLLGRKFFFLVFSLDMSKSLVPMLIASRFAHRIDLLERGWQIYWLWLAVGVAAVLGHLFSVFLKFKGGKGVATSAGFIFGLVPYYTLPAVLAVSCFVIVFYAFQMISVGSMAAAISMPVFYVALGLRAGWDPLGRQLPLAIVAVLLSGLIVYTHRTNIVRLMNGTENKVVRRR